MSEKVLAVVAGKKLTEADFAEFAKQIPQEQRMYLSNPQAQAYFVQQMVEYYMLAQYGEDEKLDETEEYAELIKKLRRDILSNMAMQKILAGITVTEEEKRAYYASTKKQFTKGETVHAKHILMESEEALLAVLEAINAGTKTFEEAAKESSTCPSGQNGGDLGEFGKGQMVKEFEDAAFQAEVGAVVGPVATQFGYHLIKVESRTEAGVAEYEEVAAQIEQMLMGQKQQAAYEEKMAELKILYC